MVNDEIAWVIYVYDKSQTGWRISEFSQILSTCSKPYNPYKPQNEHTNKA